MYLATLAHEYDTINLFTIVTNAYMYRVLFFVHLVVFCVSQIHVSSLLTIRCSFFFITSWKLYEPTDWKSHCAFLFFVRIRFTRTIRQINRISIKKKFESFSSRFIRVFRPWVHFFSSLGMCMCSESRTFSAPTLSAVHFCLLYRMLLFLSTTPPPSVLLSRIGFYLRALAVRPPVRVRCTFNIINGRSWDTESKGNNK